jgi:tRNA 2-selenouridine synthase
VIETLEIEAWIRYAQAQGSVLLDIRSEGEHAQGHIPGALSFPLLDNESRHAIGITYKELGQAAAVELGFELVGHKFASFIATARSIAPEGEVMLYCWRGGMRSNIMAWLLDLAGFRVKLLQGGYKSYRRLGHELFESSLNLLVIAGKTGSGKTELLQALQEAGQSTLDLEHLARHKGSSFGGLGQEPAPTQEHFENLLMWHLMGSREQLIWLEGESRFIGKLRIPDLFFSQMESADHIEVERNFEERLQRILVEYGSFSPEELLDKTIALRKRMGGENVKLSVDALLLGDMQGWVRPLLEYYDKTYEHAATKTTGEKIFDVDISGMDAASAAHLLVEKLYITKKNDE